MKKQYEKVESYYLLLKRKKTLWGFLASPLLYSTAVSPGVLCPDLGPQTSEEYGPAGMKDMKKIEGLEHLLFEERLNGWGTD